jgi:hypothetical protein
MQREDGRESALSSPQPTYVMGCRPGSTTSLFRVSHQDGHPGWLRAFRRIPKWVTFGHTVLDSRAGSAAFAVDWKRASGSLRPRCAQRCRSRPGCRRASRVLRTVRAVRLPTESSGMLLSIPAPRGGRPTQAHVTALSLPRRASRHFFPIQNPRWWRLILECDRTRLRCVSMRHTPLLVWCVPSGRLSHKRHS